MKEKIKLLLIVIVFLAAYYIPFEYLRVQSAIIESFNMVQDYARQHVLTCLIPAFFIAGAISVFVSQASVMKYFGAKANKILSYSVASVSGTILAVCSCTVLPLFAGIYKRGAGIGPATAFLYSGPAINVLAIILTARVLGLELGIARAVGAISFSIIIGLTMAFIYRKEELQKSADDKMFELESEEKRPLIKNAIYFFTLVLILIFAAWGKPSQPVGLWSFIYKIHWFVTGILLILLGVMLKQWFEKEELKIWIESTWTFTKQILPLLLGGVMVAGFLMGRPGMDNGIIPNRYVAMLVGGNSLWANLFASVSGALMYFATLTEIPILQGLMGSGMGKGPALALLLAGPSLSLPCIIVLLKIMGIKKMLVYVSLVVVMSTIVGMIYGRFF
ncbi:MAG: permease [Elusimicrobia bacterium RIFOXYC2_FULL_34_12]|nr:MAG: permease [Elusimicrobia bacterium RIFOXYC2_FULL_34_12]OGS38632.1 MAG: permease [Elusimicrobia bacterium RIFOXYD2_FULL_34_30]